ncbi:DUF6404 family protein [Litorivita sp. NS0012-18]|uniref:DUF6404 family protein n=1 Tax=Litorivita sp. NS0012-18 TaxID=3127655 RepID=UPI00310A220D
MLTQRDHIYSSKYQNALREMELAGVAPRDADPWTQRVLRRLGVPHRPAYYRGFCCTALMSGTLFGLFCLLFLVLIYNREGLFSVQTMTITGVLAGLFFGIGVALIVRRKAIEFKLSSWDAL